MRIAPFAACLILTGCASSSGLDANNRSAQHTPATADSPASTASSSSANGDAPAPAVAVVRELEISEFSADDVVCRREAPLGSRISVERCYSKVDAVTAAEAALDQIERQEIENLRQQQMWQEQDRLARDMVWRQRAVNQQGR